MGGVIVAGAGDLIVGEGVVDDPLFVVSARKLSLPK
jgi:hypothetical protein